MPVLVHANESTAARRRVYFHLVDATDGITPETGEGGGQPQVSSNGGAWTNTGIGTLTHIGNGRCYADLTQALVATAGTAIETRYKSANTAETPGDSVRVVAFDPYDSVRLGVTALPNAAADAAGGLPVSDAGGLDLDAVLSGNTPQTGDAFDRLGAPAGASVSADIAAAQTDLDTITDTGVTATNMRGTDGANTTTPPTAAANAAALLAATADGVAVSTILTNLLSLCVGGKFTYNPNTGVLERFAQDGTTSLGQITLTETGGTPV